jgi:hypothetical protein
VSVWQLQAGRAGLVIEPLSVGTIPATVHRLPDAAGPVVVIAHGFAGSRQLMEPFALTLARAGHIAVSFDFQGHGRNPAPMSGDVTSIDGTTRLLIDETLAVADAALALPGADGRLALLGHSMASDIVVRAAIDDPRVGATVAISMFSRAVTATDPPNLLVINGEWEGGLRDEARRVIALTDPGAAEGQTLGDPAQGTGRRAVAAPCVEHVGVLYSQTSLREARDWLNAAFGRDAAPPVQPRGGWIALLLAGVVALGWPLARALPSGGPGTVRLPARPFLLLALLPVVAVPLILWPLPTRFLPVLVADYLALHFALYGAIWLAGLWWLGALGRVTGLWVALAVAVFGIGVFGMALNEYVANFTPHAGRLWVIAAMALGAVPYMMGDALLAEGGRAPVWRVLVLRTGFLVSLALAVALDFERLFFLLIILPVVLLFFLLFGMIGGWAGRQTGHPAAAGIGLGLVLAWSLGVTFPMFVAP